MENRIPVPTDNLYKFCALFGVLLAIFSLGSIIYVNKTTNELAFSSWVEYEELRQIEKPTITEATKRKSLERQLEIAQSDKRTFMSILVWTTGLSIVPILFGFWKWFTELQPMQDELLRLQIKKLKRDLAERERSIPLRR